MKPVITCAAPLWFRNSFVFANDEPAVFEILAANAKLTTGMALPGEHAGAVHGRARSTLEFREFYMIPVARPSIPPRISPVAQKLSHRSHFYESLKNEMRVIVFYE